MKIKLPYRTRLLKDCNISKAESDSLGQGSVHNIVLTVLLKVLGVMFREYLFRLGFSVIYERGTIETTVRFEQML